MPSRVSNIFRAGLLSLSLGAVALGGTATQANAAADAAVGSAATTSNAATVSTRSVEAPSGSRAATVIAAAEAQLGKPYVWGGTGPSGFDCSGLTQHAFKAAGVNLPRVTGTQVNSGTRVSLSQLQPGDLVFYNSVSHVGIYAGNGQVIHAPRPGKSVEYTTLQGFGFGVRVA